MWGPFSPIYGTGAVMLTIVAARFSDLSTPAMFLVSALIGSAAIGLRRFIDNPMRFVSTD